MEKTESICKLLSDVQPESIPVSWAMLQAGMDELDSSGDSAVTYETLGRVFRVMYLAGFRESAAEPLGL